MGTFYYHWRFVDGDDDARLALPAWPMSELEATQWMERWQAKIEQVPDSGYEGYNIMRTPGLGD